MDELLVTCLTGGGYIVYADFAPEKVNKPYAIYSIIADKRDNHSKGQGALKEVRYQIDVYASTKAKVKEIGLDIESRLLAFADFEAFVYQSFIDPQIDDKTKTLKYVLDFKLWK